MRAKGRLPIVHILMATCEGERYLGEQLASIQAQTYPHWVLHVSDDGSRDQTLEVLKTFEKNVEALESPVGGQKLSSSRVFCYTGPNRGPTNNFLHLVQSVMARFDQEENEAEKALLGVGDDVASAVRNGIANDIAYGRTNGRANGMSNSTAHEIQGVFCQEDLFAFADQDDVWLPDKLERSVEWHKGQTGKSIESKSDKTNEVRHEFSPSNSRPMLYAARTIKVDARLRPLGWSKRPKGPLCFNAALVENSLSGNTMVMNVALMKIFRLIDLDHAVWHDWSTYQVATACSGDVWFDDSPCLLYRQHASNVIGVKTGLLNQSLRMGKVLKGRYKSWTQINLLGLKDIEHQMSLDARELVLLYKEIRECQSFWRRLSLTRGLDIRRQNTFFQVLIYLGLLLSWV